MRRSVLVWSIAAAAVGSLLFAASAGAATITVDSTADTTGDTSICTLRDAINSANWSMLTPPPAFGNCADGTHPPDPGSDTIDFSLGSGPHTIQLTSVLPGIGNDTTISGPGAGLLTIRGELGTEDYTVMPIEDDGTAPFPTVTLEGMTITNGSRGIGVGAASALTLNDATVTGNTTADTQVGTSVVGGAGINSNSGANVTINDSTISGNSATATTSGPGTCCSVFTFANGGAINVTQSASLTINASTISGNTTAAHGNQTANASGAIFSDGPLAVSRSTISGNTVTATVSEAGGAGSSRAGGGGIYKQGGGDQLNLNRVTVSGNSATATAAQGGDGSATGGGVEVVQIFANPLDTLLTGSTIAGNAVSGSGSGAVSGSNIGSSVSDPSTFISQNTINTSGSGAANCGTEGGAGFSSSGYNIDSGTSCLGTPATGDQVNTLTALGALQDNGGVQGNGDPVLTRAPALNSAAVDKGTNTGIVDATDERGAGFPRTFDMNPTNATDGTDIGAFEQSIAQDPVDPGTFTFGSQQWGTASGVQSAFLTNQTGNDVTPGTLARAGTNPGDFQLSGDSCSNTLLVTKAICGVNVSFAPVSAGNGTKNATLSLPTGVAPTTSIALTGDATEYISVAPAPKDFGSTQVGTPTGATQFTVTNAGPGTSGTFAAATLSGANASEFGITADTCMGQTLGSGLTCTVSVRFAPTSAGAKTATLNVTGTPGGTSSSALSGTGTSPAPPPPPPTTNTGATGQRAAALKKCKKKKGKARKKCKKKANKLPV